MAKSTSSKKSKKVEGDNTVTVVKFECPNCGAVEEKVFHCMDCDSPMDVEEVYEKDLEEVENDIAISQERLDENDIDAQEDSVMEEEDSDMSDLMENGLGDIYPDDGDGSSSGGNIDLTDALEALDAE